MPFFLAFLWKNKGVEKWLLGLEKGNSSQLTNPNNKRGSQAQMKKDEDPSTLEFCIQTEFKYWYELPQKGREWGGSS